MNATTNVTADATSDNTEATEALLDAVDEAGPTGVEDAFNQVEFDELDEQAIRASLRDGHPALRLLNSVNHESNIPSQFMEFVGDSIYGDEKVAMREMLQNSSAACIRRAKRIIASSDKYPDGWLTQRRIIDVSDGRVVADLGEEISLSGTSEEEIEVVSKADADSATIDPTSGGLRRVVFPRDVREVLNAAQNLGYEPVIEVDFQRKEKSLTITDNGDGMDVHTVTSEYNNAFDSKSGDDVETGGKFGVGAKSHVLLTGEDGFAIVNSVPMGDSHEGYTAQATMQGISFLPGRPDFDHPGTAIEMKLHEKMTRRKCKKVSKWVREYTEGLPVTVKYNESKNGRSVDDEEYLPTALDEGRFDAPLVIEGGSYTLLAGPKVAPSTGWSEPDNSQAFIAGMPISCYENRKNHDVTTLYDIVVFIHDEQGRVIAGPNRGYYADNLDSLHEDDVVLPEPKGSRDALKTQEGRKKPAFEYFAELVKKEEMQVASRTIKSVQNNGVVDTFYGESGKWDLFSSLVKRHGSRRTRKSGSKMKKFINNEDELPNVSGDVAKSLQNLYTDIEWSEDIKDGKSSRKRQEEKIGWVLGQGREVYMAASTGGNFLNYGSVVEANVDDASLVRISNSSKYQAHKARYGWNILKNVPLKQDDEHDFDVPDTVQKNRERQKARRTSTKDIENKVCIRTSEGSSVDSRMSFSDLIDRAENDPMHLGGHDTLIVYYSDGPNISDHYDMAKYAAIAHVSKKSMALDLLDTESAMTHNEFVGRAKTTEFETEDGMIEAQDLTDRDELIILFYAEGRKKIEDGLFDDNADSAALREHFANDLKHNRYSLDEDEDHTMVKATKPKLRQARPYFEEVAGHIPSDDMLGLSLSHRSPTGIAFVSWDQLRGRPHKYQLMVNTPNWDDDSSVYSKISKSGSYQRELFLFLHDIGIDPTNHDVNDLRELTEIDGAKEAIEEQL